jgi:hypothetical protein
MCVGRRAEGRLPETLEFTGPSVEAGSVWFGESTWRAQATQPANPAKKMMTRARFERATGGWRRRTRGLLIVGRSPQLRRLFRESCNLLVLLRYSDFLVRSRSAMRCHRVTLLGQAGGGVATRLRRRERPGSVGQLLMTHRAVDNHLLAAPGGSRLRRSTLNTGPAALGWSLAPSCSTIAKTRSTGSAVLRGGQQ